MTSVLIVSDDSAEMARLAAAVDARRGMDVVRCASGRAIVGRLVAAHSPALVLIGETSSGRQALARLAEIRSAAPQARVVVLAADPGSRWLAEALRLGATAVLPGELGAKALDTVLQEVLVPDAAGEARAALAG